MHEYSTIWINFKEAGPQSTCSRVLIQHTFSLFEAVCKSQGCVKEGIILELNIQINLN